MEVFLSRLEYELHLLLWSRTKDAKRKKNVPVQILPPGLKEKPAKPTRLREDIEALPIEELERKLSARRLPLKE